MHFCPTRKPYRPRYTAVHVRQTVSLWSTAFELARYPRFRNILSDRWALLSFPPEGSFSLVLFLSFFFSLSLFLFFPREIHSILSRYHEVIILTAFVALLRFANLKITYIFFRFSVGLRFCYFWICKFYIAYYMLLEIKVEYLNGNWEIGENLYNFITIRMLYECTRIVLKMIDKCFDFKRSRKRIILVF